ncbi:MAG: hypothetical protein IKF77_03295 [Thermoguttaceae bacterium]|nr:hypothetical protein [Thermoguttaceae bacterium]
MYHKYGLPLLFLFPLFGGTLFFASSRADRPAFPLSAEQQAACLRGAVHLDLPGSVTAAEDGMLWANLSVRWQDQVRTGGEAPISVTFYRLTLAAETLVLTDEQGERWISATDSPRTIFPEAGQTHHTMRVKLRREEPFQARGDLPRFVRVRVACELLAGWSAAPVVFSDILAPRLGSGGEYLERWEGDDFWVTLVEASCREGVLRLRAGVNFREAVDFFDSHQQRAAALRAYLLDADAVVSAPVAPKSVHPLKSGDTGTELEYLFDIPEGKRAWNFVIELPMKLSELSLELNGPDDQ